MREHLMLRWNDNYELFGKACSGQDFKGSVYKRRERETVEMDC